jgi:hypothetical protein
MCRGPIDPAIGKMLIFEMLYKTEQVTGAIRWVTFRIIASLAGFTRSVIPAKGHLHLFEVCGDL